MNLSLSMPMMSALTFADLQLALLVVEMALLGTTLLLILAARREYRARNALMQHVSMATNAITRQEYFEAVMAATQGSSKYIFAIVTATNPSREEAWIVKAILESVKQANVRGVQFRYLLPNSPDRLEMARRYRKAGADVKFHPNLIVNDARFMIVDDRQVIIGVPGESGGDQSTKYGHNIASESIAHVFRERFERQWHSSEARTYTQFLSELIYQARQFNPKVSSDVIARNLKVDKEDIDQAEMMPLDRFRHSIA